MVFYACSFGQTAIFLLGGRTKAVDPVAMYIRSGDIVVMSGPARLSYHAVPKILPASKYVCDKVFKLDSELLTSIHEKRKCTCDWCSEILSLNERIQRTLETLEWDNYEIYLRTSRINMNVRQVLKPGQTSLEDKEFVDTEDDTPPMKVFKVVSK